MRILSILTAITLLLSPVLATAEEGRLSFGGDLYAAGQSTSIDIPLDRDAFAAGYDVTLGAPVAGDAHLGGFNVNASAEISGDLYAAGFSVSVTGAVAGDITAMGNTIAISAPTPVGGNLRLAGQTVTLTAGVDGSALIAAQTATLGAPISGDFSFVGESLNFGPNARVDGQVILRGPRQIDVPATVAPPERVTFELMTGPDYATEAGKTAEHVVRSIWPAVWATGLWWLLLFVVGTAFITLAPRLVEALHLAASQRPLRRLGAGLVALAALLGFVPVLIMTIVGMVLIPFAALFVVLIWALGYLAGTYLLGARMAAALMPLDSAVKRLAVLAVSILVAGFLGMIPVVGWLVTLLLLCFGLGAIVAVLLERRKPGPTPLPQAA